MSADERLATMFPLGAYAFSPSPWTQADADTFRSYQEDMYPFRPSFYERFGFVGLPRVRTMAFPLAGLDHLLRAELPGTVSRVHVKEGYAEHRALVLRLLTERHGFAVFSDTRAAMMRDMQDRWVAVARVDGEVVGAVAYRIDQHGGDLVTDDLLVTGPWGRALLLRFFARHVDQVGRIVLTVDADEVPELWGTDLAAHTEANVRFPQSPGPMGRVLSLEGLAGLAVGPGAVSVRVVEDDLVGGSTGSRMTLGGWRSAGTPRGA